MEENQTCNISAAHLVSSNMLFVCFAGFIKNIWRRVSKTEEKQPDLRSFSRIIDVIVAVVRERVCVCLLLLLCVRVTRGKYRIRIQRFSIYTFDNPSYFTSFYIVFQLKNNSLF